MVRRIGDSNRRNVLAHWLDLKTMREVSVVERISIGSVSHIINEERERTLDLDDLRKLNKRLKEADTNSLDATRGANLLERLNELSISASALEPAAGTTLARPTY